MNSIVIHTYSGLPGTVNDLERLNAFLPSSIQLKGVLPQVHSEPSPWLCGYSRGCVEALHHGLHSKAVKGLLLISPHSGNPTPAFLRFFVSLPGLGYTLLKAMGPQQIQSFLRKTCAPQPVPPAYEALKTVYSQPALLRQALCTPEAPNHLLQQISSRSVLKPILVIHGQHDSPNMLYNTLIQHSVGVTIHSILDGGHALPWTHGSEVASCIQHFLEEHHAF